MFKWKIFYQDGTYSDINAPELAPKTGVQAIVVANDVVGRRVESTEDFYIWTPENGGWRGANHFRLAEYLQSPGVKIVLFGRTINDKDYADVMRRACNDPDLPPKTGKIKGERV